MNVLSIFSIAVFALTICAPITAQNKNESTLPQIVSMTAPVYSQAAKDAGVRGEVYVLLLVSKKGTAKVVDAYGPMAPCSNLDDPLTASVQAAAVEAAKKVTFTPATYNGKPVDKGFQLKFIFDPNGSKTSRSDEEIGSRSDSHVTWPVVINIPKAHYPEVVGQIGGLVTVKVLIYEDGLVHFAAATLGHPKLRRPAVEAACKGPLLNPPRVTVNRSSSKLCSNIISTMCL
jgi:hypothetical protein